MFQARIDKKTVSEVQSPLADLFKLLQKSLLQKESFVYPERYWLKFYEGETFDATVKKLKKLGFRAKVDFDATNWGYPYIQLKNGFLIESAESPPAIDTLPPPFLSLSQLLEESLLQKESSEAPDEIPDRYWLKFYNPKIFRVAVEGLQELGYKMHKDFNPTNYGYPYIELKSQSLKESIINLNENQQEANIAKPRP